MLISLDERSIWSVKTVIAARSFIQPTGTQLYLVNIEEQASRGFPLLPAAPRCSSISA